MSVQIIRAGAQTLDTALAIRLACMREVAGMAPEQAFSDAFVRETRAFLLEDGHTTLLLMEDGCAIACATLCYVRCIPTTGHPTGRRAHLMNVYTVPERRRMGYARLLLEELHREAAARGVTEITLDATEAGRRLYETMGYRASDEAMYYDVGRAPLKDG